MPKVGVVANFDPDRRGFLTDAMQGLVNLQLGNGNQVTNVLAAHADYGVTPLYQNPDVGTGLFPFAGGRKLQPVPGQPTLVYPVRGANGSTGTNFIRGGKAQPYREYPSFPVFRPGGVTNYGPVIIYRTDATFITRLNSWWNNSPLPPGMRYAEMNDVLAWNTLGGSPLISQADLATLYGFPLANIHSVVDVQDLDGNTKINTKPLPAGMWATHSALLADDTYWTGTCRNPEDWIDSWWYGNNHNVDKTAMKTWLNAHPGARFP